MFYKFDDRYISFLNREDVYSRTGGISIRYTAYFIVILWCMNLCFIESQLKYAISRKKISPLVEYTSSLVFLTLPLLIFNQTTLGIVSEQGGIARISFFFI